MINFEELRISNGEPLDKEKWNGLLDWVVENPFNLTDHKVSLTHPESDLTLNVEAQRDFGLLETAEGKPLSINPGRSRVGIGTTTPEAAVQIVNQNQDANGGTLVLGPQSQSNLRLGYHSAYSWIQSHGTRPLAINPLGNNVGIGTTSPTASLHVAGTLRAGVYTFTGNNVHRLIHFKRFPNLGNNVNVNTGFSSAEWNAAIVGFLAASGDIEENDVGTIINVRMIRHGTWHINADFRSHRTHENWSVDVMFVRVELSTIEGF